MSEETRRKKTDLVLSNGEYAFTQDTTTGAVKVLTGPTVLNVTGQEYPVVYDGEAERFVAVELDEAAMRSPMAPQGFYVELYNPPATESGAQPTEGSKENAPALLMGRRVILPGPTTFSLWPRQVAKVIEGHHLRSNQYLLGRVYDEEAAQENWTKAVLKTRGEESERDAADGGRAEREGTIGELTLEDLSVGRLFVIKGTDVSFYIPPTGVEVVPDEEGRFVREALTLERLQYCILVDENGDKDYQRGPKVVFPRPTQRFYEERGTGAIVFRPTELNPIQGIHVKVIAPHVDEQGVARTEGEELFITGKETSIYFPRPEHSLIRYDGSAKHFAAAVPAGEARYVMDRHEGVIRTVRGPTMLLCDPRHEVAVRRVLSSRECHLWYPGNSAVLAYNEKLGELLQRTPSTRSAPSEGEARRKLGSGRRPGPVEMADHSTVHSEAGGPLADEFLRSASYAEPRTLTLATRYAGAPAIRPWSGYAVMVVDERGDRRVVTGPERVLLDYDQTLEVLALSTGVPKSDATLEETVYLRVRDNRIEDLVVLRTADHVHVSLRYSVTADFAGDRPERWFAIRNPVDLVCGEVRARLKDCARRHPVERLHQSPESLLTDAVLGVAREDGARPGLEVPENGLRVRELEVLSLKIGDAEIAHRVAHAHASAVAAGIELEEQRRRLATDKERHALRREELRERSETEAFEAELERQRVARGTELVEARARAAVLELEKRLEEQRAADGLADETASRELARERQRAEVSRQRDAAALELELARVRAETEAAVARFTAAEGPLAEAIQLLGNQDVLARVAEAVSAQRLFGGKDVADVVSNLFAGTPLAETFDRIQRKAVPAGGGGDD